MLKRKRKFIEKIFSIRNDETCHKIVYIFGIRIRIRSKIVFLKNEIRKLKDKIQADENQDLVKPCYYIAPPLGPEYNADEDALFSNLDEEATANLNKILAVNKHASMSYAFMKKYPSIYELYDKQELKQIKEYKKCLHKAVRENDYFLYENYKLPINHISPEVFYYKHGLERIKNDKYLDGKTIIDAGAFIGDSMLMFRDRFPENEIISFEPVEKIYNLLLKTIELNNVKNVKAENYGLGDKEGVYYVDNSLNFPYVSKNKTTLNCQAMRVTTLDSYVEKNNIRVGLIKSDIEGFEQKLLRGGGQMIFKQKPILIISIYHNYSDFFKIKPLIESWNLGYRFDFFRGVDGMTTFADTMLICEPRN